MDIDKKIKELEDQELKGGFPDPQAYGQLLALYLTKLSLAEAKFLWKRIPSSVKTGNSELGLIWEVGRKMWVRDYPETYKALQKDWTDNIRTYMLTLQATIREHAIVLVSKAYSSIREEELAALLGTSVIDAIEVARSRQWAVENNFVIPKQPETKTDLKVPSDSQMAQLADYVSFLEN